MIKKLLLLLVLLPKINFAGEPDFKKLLALIPSGDSNFPTYFSNPWAAQTYLGHNNIQPNTLMPYDGMVPFGIGATKSIYKKNKHQFGISSVVHGQLGHREENNQYLQGTRTSLLNADFFLNVFYIYKLTRSIDVKLETFHRSSHLGDDLILINEIDNGTYWSTDESSYEELNLLVNKSMLMNSINLYAAGGYNYRQDSPREKWTVNIGGQFSTKTIPFIKRFVFGFDTKWIENNNWKSSTNKTIGFKLKKDGSIKLLAQHFSGNVPFSRYESEMKQTYWRFGIYFDSILK